MERREFHQETMSFEEKHESLIFVSREPLLFKRQSSPLQLRKLNYSASSLPMLTVVDETVDYS